MLNPKKVLEIGVGNGFVSNYLKQRKKDVVTADIDAGLSPNVVSSVPSFLLPTLHLMWLHVLRY